MSEEKRCGMIALIGEANVGKSTLINQLVGAKVSIVSPKAQTTRFRIRGVYNEGAAQLVLVDTPGIFDAKKTFDKAMVQAARHGISDADAILLIIDAQKGFTEGTRQIVAMLKKQQRQNVYLALNKIDRVAKPALLGLAQEAAAQNFFQAVFMISAKTGNGVDALKTTLAGVMPVSSWLYTEDQYTDLPAKLIAAEITREKLFYALKQELPYALTVETEQWKQEKGKTLHLSQAIIVEREGQKKIVIGNGGETLKTVGTKARKEMEYIFDCKVMLTLFVKVARDWKEKPGKYQALGLES